MRQMILACLLLPAFFSPALAEKPQSWKQQAEAAINDGDYQKAAQLFLKWTEADPNDAVSLYNLACCQSLLKTPKDAISTLQKAAEAGWSDSSQTADDPDLAGLHDSPLWEKTLNQIAHNAHSRNGGYTLHVCPQERWGQYLVVLPSDYSPTKKYPLVILLHGFGMSPTTFAETAGLINSSDYIYAVPEGPYVALESDGKGFSHLRERDDFGEDPRSAEKTADWIVRVADDMAKRYPLDGTRFWVVGFSQGAAMAHIVAAVHPDRVAGYCAHGGYIVKDAFNDSQLAAEKEQNVKILITHGRDDKFVSFDEAAYSSAMLKHAGLSVTFEPMDVPHEFTPEVGTRVAQWLKEQMAK
jgi:phospholipase/carboxylesterase